ncbi:hypothetical protein GCM10022224_056990 [Nonomuraea antimicrobica]|uniref:Excreted virulence factor EspC, type VII ESX diderm n=1 Tax=Nonomuraea antimicrobica TaxID=561173 RepID=A0ABP7CDC7_9ACTN
MKDSEKLRQAAAALRAIPGHLVRPVNGVRMTFPFQQYWKGPAATEFHKVLMGATKDLTALGDDIEAYARKLDNKARELEAEEKATGKPR